MNIDSLADEPFPSAVRRWKMNHFSISAQEPAALLRRIADALDQLEDVEVFDMTFKQRDDDGDVTMTVYFRFLHDPSEDAPRKPD